MAARSKRGTSRNATRSGGDSASYMSRAVVCRLGGITEHELAIWEYEEFVAPSAVVRLGRRSEPVYDEGTLRRIRTIRALAEDLGVNLPGIGVALHLLDRMSLAGED